ncbi:MAG: nucleotide pyrophosphohydrolase [Candidatus Roizmanbacteria bacterium]|nr:nucleotide pyrophosphohydrolase [Candidatus Roizmanbacteria bacterium]
MNKSFKLILENIKKFRDERDWKKFHNPKDMAEAISIESSELLELFLWKTKEQSIEFVNNKKNQEEISDEVADVMMFLIEFSDNCGIDIEKAIEKKLQKNAKKYPVNKAKGIATKYTKL